MKKVLLILGILCLFLLTNLSTVSSIEINIFNNRDYMPHIPISIDGNNEFTIENGVTGGSGTSNDPYIIEGWEIIPTFFKDGISISNSNAYFVIKNCYVHEGGGNENGIVFYDVHNGVIDNNIISGNRNGIYLGGQYVTCRNNVISNNSIYLNSHNGIEFAHTMDFHTNNVITHNYIAYNGGDGIYSTMSYYHEIAYNNISSNGNGIVLHVCMGGEYHKIHHNNFFNNVENQVIEPWEGYENYFDDDYPSGGNYWDDYTGEDYFSGPSQDMPGSDGIGDTPYDVPRGYNQDRYPLMSPCQLNENIPPTQPIIAGPTKIKPGLEYSYTFIATDPNNDNLYYYIDWDDDTYENWLGPYSSGAEVMVNHTWSEKGKYTIKARAKNTNDLLSPWGILEITISRNKATNNVLFFRFLERFPMLERFLNILIK